MPFCNETDRILARCDQIIRPKGSRLPAGTDDGETIGMPESSLALGGKVSLLNAMMNAQLGRTAVSVHVAIESLASQKFLAINKEWSDAATRASARCSSPVQGNLHAGFLEGGVAAR